MKFSKNLTMFLTWIVASLYVVNGQRSTWMKDMSDLSTDYGFDLFSKTIFEVVWPGSSHAGMYTSALQTTDSTDSYAAILNSETNTTKEKQEWSERQRQDVLRQLRYGSRFLDLQFEYDGTNYRAHNGLLGDTADNIATNINNFLASSYGPDEIVIIYLNNFISGTGGDIDDLMDIFSTELDTKITSNAVDLTTAALSTLTGTVIAFTDDIGSNTNGDFFDSSILLNGTRPFEEFSDDARTTIIGELTKGLTSNILNLIYWTLDFSSSNDFPDLSLNEYTSGFFSYSRTLNYELSSTIQSYPKLEFSNVLIVDFFTSSDAIEMAIQLNYFYGNCNNLYSYSGDCSSETDLVNEYYNDDESNDCVIDNTLDTNCARSCGLCPYISGVPGSNCTSSTDCNSAIYSGLTSGNGRCFIRDDDWSSFISEKSFCLTDDPFSACASTDEEDVCSNTTIDTSDCFDGCSSDWQCSSGYCSSTYGVCLSFNYSSETTPSPTTVQGYSFLKSTTAIQFRSDIDGLRPGDPDASYSFEFAECSGSDCVTSYSDANPYITSLIGFILVPFIISLWLFFCWTACFCPCWLCECCCCCGNPKKCCCQPCCNPKESLIAKWLPCALLFGTLIVILWACIEGISANSAMHDHIFSDSNSFKSEVNDLFTDISDILGGVEPTANSIIDDIVDIIEIVTTSLNNTDELDSFIDNIRSAIDLMASGFTGNVTISAEIKNPFYDINETFSFTCDYCSSISDTITTLNDTVNDVVVSGLTDLTSAINSTELIIEVEEQIDSAVQSFLTTIDSFVNLTEEYQENANTYFDSFEPYDEQRETGGFFFFIIPLIWLVLPILGVVLSILTGNDEESSDNNCLAKCCFKINWCIAMYLGSTVMLILSFFSIISVSWADFCVRLDDFEENLGNSDLGQQIGDALGNGTLIQAYQVINSCFYGTSILEIFNLTDLLDFDSYRDEVADTLDIDITSYFQNNDLESFESELDLLDTSTFTSITDESIDAVNAHNSTSCYCPTAGLGSAPYASGIPFTRELLFYNNCTGPNLDANNATLPQNYADFRDSYWAQRFIRDLTCTTLFSTAYGYVHAEDSLNSQINDTLFSLKQGGELIFDAYDDIYALAVRLENTLVEIICALDPLFDNFDTILYEYGNCAFIGEIYEGFKNVGCELLFSDMYYITRSMSLIAFLSIIIVFFSMCMDYVVAPRLNQGDDEFLDKEEVASGDTEMANRTSYGGPGGPGTTADVQPGGPGSSPGGEGPQFV